MKFELQESVCRDIQKSENALEITKQAMKLVREACLTIESIIPNSEKFNTHTYASVLINLNCVKGGIIDVQCLIRQQIDNLNKNLKILQAGKVKHKRDYRLVTDSIDEERYKELGK